MGKDTRPVRKVRFPRKLPGSYRAPPPKNELRCVCNLSASLLRLRDKVGAKSVTFASQLLAPHGRTPTIPNSSPTIPNSSLTIPDSSPTIPDAARRIRCRALRASNDHDDHPGGGRLINPMIRHSASLTCSREGVCVVRKVICSSKREPQGRHFVRLRPGWPALRPATDIHSPHRDTRRVSLFHRFCPRTNDLHGALAVLHTHTRPDRPAVGRMSCMAPWQFYTHTHGHTPAAGG